MDDESILVLAVMFNSADVLPAFLASLGPGMHGLGWHLVLVDNDSTDGSVELAGRLAPDAVVVETGANRGYSAGINAGVTADERGHSAVLVLNPDVRLTQGAGATLVEALREPGVGITVPRLTDGEGRLLFSMRREPTLLRMLADATIGAVRAGRIGSLGETVTQPRQYTRRQTVAWAEGAAMLVSALCMNAAGGWDESFFLYSEETDFALRARDLGFATTYVPEAGCVHLQGGSSTNAALWPLVTRNRVHLYRRRHGAVSGFLFYAAVLLREASRALLGRATSRAALRVLISPRRMREQPGPWSVTRGLRA